MGKFQYIYFLVDVAEPCGRITYEIKAKSEENAIKQINKMVSESNSAENLKLSWFERKAPILNVYWDTLRVDRVGYERLY